MIFSKIKKNNLKICRLCDIRNLEYEESLLYFKNYKDYQILRLILVNIFGI